MTLSELNVILADTGYPVAYLAFPDTEAPAMPFIVYQEIGSDNVGADNRVWHSATQIQIDLINDSRNREAEQVLEDIFDAHSIYWERTLQHNHDERVYRTSYTVEV